MSRRKQRGSSSKASEEGQLEVSSSSGIASIAFRRRRRRNTRHHTWLRVSHLFVSSDGTHGRRRAARAHASTAGEGGETEANAASHPNVTPAGVTPNTPEGLRLRAKKKKRDRWFARSLDRRRRSRLASWRRRRVFLVSRLVSFKRGERGDVDLRLLGGGFSLVPGLLLHFDFFLGRHGGTDQY